MEWYKFFKFKKNPFENNPIKRKFEIFDREKECEDVLYNIVSGNMLIIEGAEGVGKTTLLKHAIDNFKGKGKVIYVDAAKLNKRLDIVKLLDKKPKGMILLLDNVESLSKKNNDKIKYFYDQDYIKSVIFTTQSYKSVSFSQSIIDRIGKNIIELKPLPKNTVLEIAKKRLNGSDMIPDEVLEKIYSLSKSLKHFFIICNNLGEYLLENEKDIAELSDLKYVDLFDHSYRDKEKIFYCAKCKHELENIKGHWRCPNCDVYCMHCGAIVDKEDLTCPECGIEFIDEGDEL